MEMGDADMPGHLFIHLTQPRCQPRCLAWSLYVLVSSRRPFGSENPPLPIPAPRRSALGMSVVSLVLLLRVFEGRSGERTGFGAGVRWMRME